MKLKTLMIVLLVTTLASAVPAPETRPYLDAALQTARWIGSAAINTEHGIIWPANPADPKSVSINLYSGTPGVVLFLLEAHRVTGKASFLEQARAGADYLVASLPEQKQAGLYTGMAGLGFVLNEVYKSSGERKYRQAAVRCLEWLTKKAVPTGQGVQWSEVTDIIGGGAGIGLFLIHAAREFDNPAYLELAVRAGLPLIELGQAEAGGTKWAMDPKFPRLMPNFSHGTAGVGYFLATLYRETKRKEFLGAALSGARYLLAVAKTDGDACLIFHNEPEGRDLYYLGWCHGPAGTARFFYRLWQATGDDQWLEWTKRSARAILQSGIPERQTPGFWNNVGQCCGSAGVAEFFLQMHRLTGESDYLDFSLRLTSDLLARASSRDGGMRWVQAEHRIRPELLLAQTGYMQGAAGIGLWLLRLDAHLQNRAMTFRLPDSPW